MPFICTYIYKINFLPPVHNIILTPLILIVILCVAKNLCLQIFKPINEILRFAQDDRSNRNAFTKSDPIPCHIIRPEHPSANDSILAIFIVYLVHGAG